MINKIILLSIAVLLGLGLLLLMECEAKNRKDKEENVVSYIEQAGGGIVLGKKTVGKYNETEVAIQIKDTILYSNNKEWYYLLKEGDSVKIKDKKNIQNKLKNDENNA